MPEHRVGSIDEFPSGEGRVVKIAGKEVKRVFYTCETCHSLHQSTPWPRYTRAPFKEKSDLCSGCHS